jgi:hypothetical protein
MPLGFILSIDVSPSAAMLLSQSAMLGILVPIFFGTLIFYIFVFAFGFMELKQLRWIALQIAISSLISQGFLLVQAVTMSYSRNLIFILCNQVFYYYILVAVLGCYSFYGRLYSLSKWMDVRMLTALSALLITGFIVLLVYNILYICYLFRDSDISHHNWVTFVICLM